MISKVSYLTGVLALLIIGCGESGPPIASVEGTITMDGKPLANASVVFSPESGRPAGAKTDAEGHYVLNFSAGRKGAVPGKNRVQIRTGSEGGIADDGSRSPGTPETVPAQFNDQSTLEFVVEDGKVNVADFEVTSEGEISKREADDN